MQGDLSVEELVVDDSFRNYCFQSNEADVLYWKYYTSLYPSQREKIEEARKIILMLRIMFEEENIRKRLTTANATHSAHSIHNIRKWTVSVAASLIMLLSSAAYFYFSRKDTRPDLVRTSGLPADVAAPRSSKAKIALANGQEVYLDSAVNGTMATQGSTKLLKLSVNTIAYQPTKKQSGGEEQYNTLTNPNGSSIIHIQLADGSHVWLNVGSSLTYPVAFLQKERKVWVTGEAYFEVARNAAQPFNVCNGNTEIRVLGTHFNVNAYDDENDMKVTLLQGMVNVSRAMASALLNPGQQASVTETIQVQNNIDTDAVMAWKNGYFHFNGANLQEVLKQLARWYDVEVFYSGAIPSREFAGEIERGLNLSQVLRILEQNKVHFKIQQKKIIVLP